MVTAAEFKTERITYEEAADLVGVKPQTIRAWICRGAHSFPQPVEIGSLRYLLRREVEAWIDARVKRGG